MSLADLRHGASTAWRLPQLRILLLATSVSWTMINVFFILEPLFVREALGREDAALLYLWAAHGAGALVGAIWITRARHLTGREPTLVCAGILLVGTGIVVYTAVAAYPVALAASALSGVGFALFFPPLLALIQRVIPEDQRGRVTSVFVALQETAGLVSSLGVFALGAFVAVGPALVTAGVLIALVGAAGLRAERRASREVRARGREAA
jgi:Na+/melibiose symporter-like transporter